MRSELHSLAAESLGRAVVFIRWDLHTVGVELAPVYLALPDVWTIEVLMAWRVAEFGVDVVFLTFWRPLRSRRARRGAAGRADAQDRHRRRGRSRAVPR